MIQTEKFARNPFYVFAVRLTDDNFDEIVEWTKGIVQTQRSRKYINVVVDNPQNDRQTKAFVGDWVLHSDTGFKIYTDKAFKKNFSLVEGDDAEVKHHETSYRSAETGQYVAEEQAEANPDTTVKEEN